MLVIVGMSLFVDGSNRLLFALLLGPFLGGFGVAGIIESEELLLLLIGCAHSTSEDILVFLLGEVKVIVSVGMRVLGRVVAIILPERIGSESSTLSVFPGLQLKVTDSAVLVVVGNRHCALISLVINNFSAKVPLLLLLKTLEDMVGANFHHGKLVIEARFSTLLGGAKLELADLLVATTGDEVGNQGHVLGVLH